MAKQADYVRYTIRVPSDLYARVQEAAGEKSVNAEIVTRMERSEGVVQLIRDYEQAEKDLFEASVKVRSLQAELELAQGALADQKKVTAMLQQLLKESADEAKQIQEEREAANQVIAKKYNDLVEQRKLLEGLKEELEHLSHARGNGEGETARLARQQAESFERLERRIDHLTKGLVVYGRAFELSTDGDQKRAIEILDKAIDEVEAQGRDEDTPADKKAG